jgi:DNA replication protein DnaC
MSQAVQDLLATMGNPDTSAEPVARRHLCERCGEAHGADCWICARCLNHHRTEVRVAMLRRLEQTIPDSHRGVTFGSDALRSRVTGSRIDEKTLAAVRGGRNVTTLLVGPAGAGKTSLAVALLYDAFDRGQPRGMFIDAMNLAHARAMHPLGQDEAPLVRDAKRTGVLVLDDMGAEKQDIAGTVYEVLFERHAHARRTIVTTGLHKPQLEERYGAGAMRRLMPNADSLIRVGGQ